MRTVLPKFLFLTFIGLALCAETTVKEYKAAMAREDSARSMRVYVMGLGEGMAWANVTAMKKGSPLYCQSLTMGVRPEDYLDILDAEIKAASNRMPADELDKAFIGLALVSGLQARFPCSE